MQSLSKFVAGLTAVVAVSVGCRGPQAVVEPPVPAANEEQQAAITRIRTALEESPLYDATVLLARQGEAPLVFIKGAGGADVEYAADSAQKWVVASVLLAEAKKVDVTSDTPLENFPFPRGVEGERAAITLGELLSFTGGFENPPLCASLAGADFHTCTERIVESELTTPKRFYYGTHHMMVAARGLADDDETYADLLARFKADTGLFPTSFNQSSEMPLQFRTNASEYMAFLQALLAGELLDADVLDEMMSDQVGAKDIAMSPADDVGDGWKYGFGNWVHCDGECDTQHHSAGARGFYPWVDLGNGTLGVVAFNGRVGDWQLSHAFFTEIRDAIPAAVGASQ